MNFNIRINGIVQGVGFRPFINRLANECGLKGWIRNTNEGAEIEVEGENKDGVDFVWKLMERRPPLAFIGSVRISQGKEQGYKTFEIIKSEEPVGCRTLISPDIGICPDCLAELKDPSDRRYRYPFINCTNCGPRFTIIRDIPYDRKNTTMADFSMCSDCLEEYGDIEDRRYHAQPDCCSICGPELTLIGPDKEPIGGDPIEELKKVLMGGKIAAIKGIGGFHLACTADNEEAVKTLRQRKHRDKKAFALMVRDTETARRYALVSEKEREALESFRKPIVLLKKKERGSYSYLSENNYLGIMLPYTPVHALLLEGIDALVMTSANLSDLPIVYKNEQALKELSGIADYFLLNNREIERRCDDSLQWIIDGREYPVRRSRGYVPYPLNLKIDRNTDGILACGAEQKASFLLTKGKYAFVSQHIGDLKNIETFENYTAQISDFRKLFDIEPSLIACDLHPDYMSSVYAAEEAERSGLKVVKVQHHHAHMASCMADNGLDGICLGIIWDGTGLGTDGNIWGSEFLVGGFGGFTRMASIRNIRLPGGDKAVMEPFRCAISLLEDSGIDSTELFPGESSDSIRAMLAGDINCPRSSGMGRLFDGVSAILGITDIASYEGEGAVLLEATAGDSDGIYPYSVEEGDAMAFDFREMIRCICREKSQGRDISLIAADFMNTLVKMAVEISIKIRKLKGINRVVLSGGTFQNIYMLRRITDALESEGFEVFRHRNVPANDEGICLGQAMIAAYGERLCV